MRHIKLSILLFTLSVLTYFSCKNKSESEVMNRGLSTQYIDSSINPGDNFFLFANGKWYDTASIAPSESRAGARLEMDYVAKAHIKSILEDVAIAKNESGSIEQQVGDFFASGMDSVNIEKLGFNPIKPWLAEIDSIREPKDVLQFVAKQYTYGNPILFGFYVGADEKNSKKNIALFYQSGLGLPDRDYYFKKDEATQSVVNDYKKYIQTLFTLTGWDSVSAIKKAKEVYDLEKLLAISHRTNVELRDPQNNYNKMAVADLDKKMPVISWNNLLENLNIKTDSLNISQPAYYSTLNDLLKAVSVNTWRSYLRFHTIDNLASALSNDFVNASFEFNGKTLSGQKKLKERWERNYSVIDQNLGEALGQLYVKKHFSDDAKKKMQQLVNNLQVAFEKRIDKLDWMSDSTKQKAIAKLQTFIKKVGFPDKWRDYSKVAISKNDFFGNLLACSKNEYNFQISKIDQPVDKSEWGMTPPTNNAYYNPTTNEIVFPAGILQFPMFDVNSDDALNYGGIGMVIGHELTHGFDDQGAQYDKEGNLKNWWLPEDFDKFKTKSEAVVKLYNGFTVLDSMHINGSLTQGENIADIGGIAIAYDAFKMTDQGKDTIKIQGLTPDQRFFLSFAQCWRKKLRDEALRIQINTDPHSPAMYRVWGPLMNFTPFYSAFDVKENNKMFVAEVDRLHIW